LNQKKRVTSGCNWLTAILPLVTLPESVTLVLHFSIDVKVLHKLGKKYLWPKPERCPVCGSFQLWGHGYASRYFEQYVEPLWVKRFRCPGCFAIHTCRPAGFLQGIRHSACGVYECLLSKIRNNRWLRAVARQNQQYWYRMLRIRLSGRQTIFNPSVDDLKAFFSRLDHFAPLRR
jgi:hypothetical protein